MRRRLSCLLICLLVSASAVTGMPVSEPKQSGQPAQTQTDEPSNTSLTRTPQPKISKQELAQLQESIYQYEQAISEIESQFGAYGAAMGQQLDSLGNAYQKLGKHEEAIGVFKRAIHVTRIHEGLYTPSQLPMVEKLLQSHTTLGQWKEVSNKLQYIYWLNKMNFGENDPRMLPALNRLSRWHLQAYALEIGRDREAVTQHLILAHTMIERSINLLEQSGTDRQMLIQQLNGLTLTNYLFATYSRSPISRSASNSPHDQEARRSSQTIDVYINRSFRSGRDAIGRVIDLHQSNVSSSAYDIAKAKVKLGDWLFLFNKRDAAFETYSEAWELLNQTGSAEAELKSIFDQPVALPSEDLLETNNYYVAEQTKYDAGNHYVLASFDVTPLGKASNIEIIESMPPDNISARSMVKRSLRVAKFRPRFVAGEPTFTENMQLRILSH